MLGIVRLVNTIKNFGFIKAGDYNDFFFHKADFNGHWDDLVQDFTNRKQIIVEFEHDAGIGKGPRAKCVKRMDYPNEG